MLVEFGVSVSLVITSICVEGKYHYLLIPRICMLCHLHFFYIEHVKMPCLCSIDVPGFCIKQGLWFRNTFSGPDKYENQPYLITNGIDNFTAAIYCTSSGWSIAHLQKLP